MLEKPNDLVIRKFSLGQENHRCAVVFIDGLADKQQINSNVLKNLQLLSEKKELNHNRNELLNEIEKELVSTGDVERGKTLDEVSFALLYGSAILYLDGISQVLILDVKGWETRSIEEPITETLIRGPREGFIEDLRTNMMLIRRNIRDPNLRFQTHQVGRRSKKIWWCLMWRGLFTRIS